MTDTHTLMTNLRQAQEAMTTALSALQRATTDDETGRTAGILHEATEAAERASDVICHITGDLPNGKRESATARTLHLIRLLREHADEKLRTTGERNAHLNIVEKMRRAAIEQEHATYLYDVAPDTREDALSCYLTDTREEVDGFGPVDTNTGEHIEQEATKRLLADLEFVRDMLTR